MAEDLYEQKFNILLVICVSAMFISSLTFCKNVYINKQNKQKTHPGCCGSVDWVPGLQTEGSPV